MIIAKDYLGDSVYCQFDGFALVLTTENGPLPGNVIVIEPAVFSALLRYKARVDAAIAEYHQKQNNKPQ